MGNTTTFNPPQLDQARPFLSAGRFLSPQRYIVGWPDGVVKIGSTCSGRRRWGVFLARGAKMIDLAHYPYPSHARAAEKYLHDLIRPNFPPAFPTSEAANERLGNRGGGYGECWVIPETEWEFLAELGRMD